MQDGPQTTHPDSLQDLTNIVYWSKLSMGMLFGFLSYMIMRLSDLTFFFVVPLLLIVALLISVIIVVVYDRRHDTQLPRKRIFKRSIMYTGTYFIAFIALATLSFYWGA
ncbi:MAG: hypothetical protein EAX87_02200 [Candidatus Thorarchaeota archaeon]|nr:hypothetical protein [Candidatus Thorarchaeota archaeon]